MKLSTCQIRRFGTMLMLALSAHGAWAVGDPAQGRVLYNDTTKGNLGSACVSCHLVNPGRNVSLLLKGSKAPGVIQAAISANIGQMGEFIGAFTSAQLDDIAAYISAVPTASSTSLSFATSGGTAQTQAVTITNPGGIYYSIPANGVTISGAQSSEFSVDASGCTGKVLSGSQTPTNPLSQCVLSVTFTPSSASSHVATLNVAGTPSAANGAAVTAAAPASLAIALTGTNAVASVTSAALSGTTLAINFDTTTQTRPVQSVDLNNTGNTNVTITAIDVVDALNLISLATGSGYCKNGDVIAGGSSCKVGLTATGASSATVNITTSAGPFQLSASSDAAPVNSNTGTGSGASAGTGASTNSVASVTPSSSNQGAGGCTIAGPQAEIDPIWPLMLLGAIGAYGWRQRRKPVARQ
jgi:hypothetical protein